MGVTLLAGDLSPEDRATVEAMAGALGTVHWIDEALFDAATAIASSSPAWTFQYIAALARAGTAAGIAAELATQIALEAVAGSAAYALGDGRAMDDLAREVASPGGMTQAGLDVLALDGALTTLLQQTVQAAIARAATLAREADA